MKKAYWTPGNIILIKLPNEMYSYGRVLEFPLMGFYNLQSAEILPAESVVSNDIIFKLWVMKYAISKHHWSVIGHIPLEEELKKKPKFFMQDIATGKLSTTYDGGEEIPAAREECEQLEQAAVWDPDHVESRLVDHFAGRPNDIFNSSRPK